MPMRRNDKEITEQRQMDDIIRNSLVCRVALAKDNMPSPSSVVIARMPSRGRGSRPESISLASRRTAST